MVTITAAAPIDGPAVLPDALINQYVKPGEGQELLVDSLRLTALMWVEQHTGHSLARRQWTAVFNRFDGALWLKRQPVRSVASVAYTDTGDQPATVRVRWDRNGRVLPVQEPRWPVACGPITVTFDAGYDDVATEAPGLQVAALMMIKHLFDGGSVDDVPATVTALLDAQYRTPVAG
ncbi:MULTISPECIES: head-tail connector protein [Sphingomonas]|uniref:PhiE125 gp8 family phage protein n=1 Tax=Sphingomonas hankookensis TaxID=563996 RepID=A0ABR5Y8A2_9SPHN|nr:MULTISPECIES: hypothetical protein [Sphingomonas]KZE09133.1 hypothetical protein AVT10_06700 [Sphingomonas hankookensis]PZT95563.1 MAG: hypothetical protein DI625_02160 [Sphingomonas sp.]